MELILDFSSYKDKNIGKLVFNSYIFSFRYEYNILSVLITHKTMEEIHFMFDLINLENKNDLLNKDSVFILSKMNSISYIKSILPIDKITDLIISNFRLDQRKIESITLHYIKIFFINEFVFIYKRNIGLMTKLIIHQTSKQKIHHLNENYHENRFHIDIINNCQTLFHYDKEFADDMIRSILQEI